MPSWRERGLWAAAIAAYAAWLTWRAATQAITHDEALTYKWFVSGTWGALFTEYNANHHVLHSILVKLVTSIFGVSELTLRLPALLGGVAYAIGCARLSKRLLGSGVWAALTFALLTLNPFIVDFLIASRGYALAMGFFILHIDELWRRRLIRASILAGLAVSANLTFLFGVAATIAAWLLLDRSRTIVDAGRLVLPAPAVIGVICGGPLLDALQSDFHVGVPTLGETVSRIANVSFAHGARDYLPMALPAIAIAAACACIAVARRAPAPRFFAVAGAIGVVEMLTAKLLMDVLYPLPRTGLYLLILVTLFLATGTAAMARPVFAIPLLVLGVAYALQIQSSSFREWRYDAATRRMFVQVLDQPRPRAPIRICADWPYEPTLNFYRNLYGAAAVEPIDRKVFDRCDFVLINVRESFHDIRHDLLFSQNRLREITRDPESGSVLLARAH